MYIDIHKKTVTSAALILTCLVHAVASFLAPAPASYAWFAMGTLLFAFTYVFVLTVFLTHTHTCARAHMHMHTHVHALSHGLHFAMFLFSPHV